MRRSHGMVVADFDTTRQLALATNNPQSSRIALHSTDPACGKEQTNALPAGLESQVHVSDAGDNTRLNIGATRREGITSFKEGRQEPESKFG